MSKITITVSVDWEGRSLLTENLAAMRAFREKHPDVPLQHFLNPAYYTRTRVDRPATTEAVRSVLRPDDEHGLHVHAWRSLLDASGVKALPASTLLRDDGRVKRAEDDWGFFPPEEGYDTPLEYFEVDDLRRMMQTSKQILVEEGFESAESFRAGAWMCGPRVQQALVQTGFKADCSAADVRPVERRFGLIPLCDRLRELWPTIDESSQPYVIHTASGPLWEVPNNGNLVDYLTPEELVNVFEGHGRQWEANPNAPRFVSTGFHQETARVFLVRLHEAVSKIKSIAAAKGWPLLFTAKPTSFLGSPPS